MGEVPKQIFAFWVARNAMSAQRQACLESMREHLGTYLRFLEYRDWLDLILPDFPLHPGFRYLSCNHRSDYLRCYFMHHYGGGYAGIKMQTPNHNWRLCFDIIDKFPQIQVIGMPEVVNGSGIPEYNRAQPLNKLLSNGWFICRPYSEFTTEWYRRLGKRMDDFLPELREHPATDVFGQNPDYPVPWCELQGNIFHPLLLEFREKNPESLLSGLQPGCILGHPYR